MASIWQQSWWANASRDEQLHRQGKQLARFLRDCVQPFSPHYRAMFREHGIDARDIRSVEDLQKLPFTSKADLQTPRDFVLAPDAEVLKRRFSTVLSAMRHGAAGAKRQLEREWRPIFMTSTTGRSATPVPFFYTRRELDMLEESGRRMMVLGKSDAAYRHVNAFPFAPHLAFWLAHHASLGFNTFMLSTGGGKVMGTEGNVKMVDRIDPDVVIAMPTFLYHLLQHATSIGSRWTKMKRLVLGGEKVPLGMRRKLLSLCEELGSPEACVISTYGFTEAKVAWTECCVPPSAMPTGFHLYPDMGIIEIIDPVSGQLMPDGQGGEIVYTPIDARGSVVVRYRTGDMIDGGIHYEPCPACGRTCPRLVGNISRVSDRRELNIEKLKGTLVDFAALEHMLDDAEGVGAWQIELRKRNDDPLECDEVTVHLVPLNGDAPETLIHRIEQCFHERLEFSPNAVLLHDWDEMRRLQGVGKELKEQKVVDHRPTQSSS